MKDMRGQAQHGEPGLCAPSAGARASVVNRTRRVVHDQALRLREERSRSRSLWVPLAICSTLLLVIFYAIWGSMMGYDLIPTGIPDASEQMLFLILLWSTPVAAGALGLIPFRRSRAAHESAREGTR